MTVVKCKRKYCESFIGGCCIAVEIEIDYYDGCEMYNKKEKESKRNVVQADTEKDKDE